LLCTHIHSSPDSVWFIYINGPYAIITTAVSSDLVSYTQL